MVIAHGHFNLSQGYLRHVWIIILTPACHTLLIYILEISKVLSANFY